MSDLRARLAALDLAQVLPKQRGLYYNGCWHDGGGTPLPITSPSTGESLGMVAQASPEDIEEAVTAAHQGYLSWRDVSPFERGRILREAARILRANALELAMIDAADCGNPVRAMTGDAELAAGGLDYFAGLVQETKGETIPMGPGHLNMTLREPLGVCLRIIPFNHPMMFAAMRAAAPLAAGNALIVKTPEQAPLSSLRLAELWDGLFPPGVFNILSGGADVGAALIRHRKTAKVGLIGSVPTGRKVMQVASERLIPVGLELGGKNALVAFPDCDPDEIAQAAVSGMNFTWCGQSCGSTSRAFIHADLYEQVVDKIVALAAKIHPGLPLDYETDMGALISKPHMERVQGFIASGLAEGARLVTGGEPPKSAELSGGYFLPPTVFADVTPGMTIAREEIFGPVLAILSWKDEDDLFEAVNDVDYGLTAAVWTKDLNTALRASARIEAGYIWVNNVSRHFLGTPFGGFKQSGMGKEESLEELLEHTRVKTVNIRLN